MLGTDQDRERAASATGNELAALLHHPATDVLLTLLDNPALEETQLCLLLERKIFPPKFSKRSLAASRCSKITA